MRTSIRAAAALLLGCALADQATAQEPPGGVLYDVPQAAEMPVVQIDDTTILAIADVNPMVAQVLVFLDVRHRANVYNVKRGQFEPPGNLTRETIRLRLQGAAPEALMNSMQPVPEGRHAYLHWDSASAGPATLRVVFESDEVDAQGKVQRALGAPIEITLVADHGGVSHVQNWQVMTTPPGVLK
jgi:hypothetical protein